DAVPAAAARAARKPGPALIDSGVPRRGAAARRSRYPDREDGPMGLGRAGADRPAVRLRHRPDDRQSEPAPGSRAACLRPAEPFERVLAEPGRESGSPIGDHELELIAVLATAQRDRSAAVADRVLDEVAEHRLDPP